MNRKLLGIYLNDHLAGSTVGLELARRAAGANQGNEYGAFLAPLADEIQEDRESLREIMRRLEYGEDVPKKVGAWTAEKLGRLKPNGQLRGYSPLSRVVELEGLTLGITGKLALWKSLQELVGEEPRLEPEELGRLRERAERQQRDIEGHRLRAVREAYLGGSA